IDVAAKQATEFLLPLEAPGIAVLQDSLEGPAGVDCEGIDAEAGFLAREAPPLRRQPLFVPDLVEQVGGVAPIEDAETGIEPDARGMLAQQSGADGVEGACPRQPEGDALLPAGAL